MENGFTSHLLVFKKRRNLREAPRKGEGFIVVLASILVLAAGLIIVLSAGYISLNAIKSARNNVYSTQAYYLAEAGIEDSLLRLRKGMNFSQSNSLTINGGTVTIEVSDPIGGSRTITSLGNIFDRIRKLRVIFVIKTDNISFHYGAQAGEGGVEMENNSRIKGNVFSIGSITGINGKGYIDYTAKVATIGSGIQGLVIGEDAYTHNCKDCSIGGSLYYSGGGQENCTASQGIKEHPVQEAKDLPISDGQITKWKNEALTGGVFINNYTVAGGFFDSLGPKKIEGNLVLENNATLIVNGTIWVIGNLILNNNALIKLSYGYGSLSGVIIVDGRIELKNDVVIEGSGEDGSYLMLLSTNNSLVLDAPAIDIINTAQGAIFYASNGLIRLRNNIQVREATGYKLHLDNNAIIEYESGLEDTGFINGPGGSWELVNWLEVE